MVPTAAQLLGHTQTAPSAHKIHTTLAQPTAGDWEWRGEVFLKEQFCAQPLWLQAGPRVTAMATPVVCDCEGRVWKNVRLIGSSLLQSSKFTPTQLKEATGVGAPCGSQDGLRHRGEDTAGHRKFINSDYKEQERRITSLCELTYTALPTFIQQQTLQPPNINTALSYQPLCQPPPTSSMEIQHHLYRERLGSHP
ncbi:hypothetical protein JZ751_029116 [Albula glossodonta]|uniref:Uncharacterized protein n=1 Tax=Albula glossodonta TaxID=121402 RepID=A0A8T2P976_9TELE|nr:hypothetical protein JZ751_029116 [Albula glossodonta]